MDALLSYLIEQGVWGIVVIGLGWAYLAERKENTSLRDQITNINDETSKHVGSLYEKRIEDMQRTTTAINDIDKTISALVATSKAVLDSLKERG